MQARSAWVRPLAWTLVCLGLGLPATSHALTAQPAVYVNGIATSAFDPPSPDPAGLAYDAGRDAFLISDSEVEEPPSPTFTGQNLWTLPRGTSAGVGTGSTLSYSASVPSEEPTGLGWDESTRTLYVSDDDRHRIYIDQPGADTIHGTADDVVSFFRIDPDGDGAFNLDIDAEGIEFDAVTGHLFLCDGSNPAIWEIDPIDGVFGNAGDLWTSFDMAGYGMGDCEGLGSDYRRGTLLAVEPFQRRAYEVTKSGALVRIIDLSAIPPPQRQTAALSSLTLAPSSSSADAADTMSYWVTDRQVDNGADPNENDGLLHEYAIPPAGPVHFAAASQTAGEQDGTATVTVTRPTGGLAGTVRVRSTTGTAVDHVLSFGVGATSATVTVPIPQDALDEPDEHLPLELIDPTGDLALGAPATTTLTITDDDPAPTLSIGDTSVTEGDGTGTELTFTVALSTVSGRPISVAVQTEAGTAGAADFTAVYTTVEIPAGSTRAQVAVPVTGDVAKEGDEQLTLRLSDPVHAVLDDDTAVGTITDNDPPEPTPDPAAAALAGTRRTVGRDGVVRLGRLPKDTSTRTVVVCAGDPKRRARPCGLGRRTARVPAGGAPRLSVRLRRAARLKLRRQGFLRVRLTVTVTSDARTRQASAVVRLKRRRT
jgi:sugar lactone lactonase YvrE